MTPNPTSDPPPSHRSEQSKANLITWPSTRTTPTALQIWAASLRPILDLPLAVDNGKEGSLRVIVQKLHDELLADSTANFFRKNYTEYVRRIYQAHYSAGELSAELCVRCAHAGLQEMRSSFFSDKNLSATKKAGDRIRTVTIQSSVDTSLSDEYLTPLADNMVAAFGFEVPINSGQKYTHCDTFVGISRHLSALSAYGAMEADAALHVKEVLEWANESRGGRTSKLCRFLDEVVFVILGATSALGPFAILSQLGATIVAIARNGPKLQSVIENVQHLKSSNLQCTVHLPLYVDSSADDSEKPSFPLGRFSTLDGDVLEKVGVDLISDYAEIADWLIQLEPSKKLVICNLAYADGEAHVRAVAAMDYISQKVCNRRPDTTLSYLISPTTIHSVTDACVSDSENRRRDIIVPLWQQPFIWAGGLRPPVYVAKNLLDGTVNLQGPNYSLAKALQGWRAIVASRDGIDVSANIAPAARTKSVISRAETAAALEGIQALFPPFVAFDPKVASSIMSALLLWDLIAKKGKNHKHVMEKFVLNRVHGGIDRMPYSMDSVGFISTLTGFFLKKGKCPEGVLFHKKYGGLTKGDQNGGKNEDGRNFLCNLV